MRASATALAAAAALLLVAGCNAYLGPSSRDSNWHVIDSTHFVLHVRPGSFAEQNASTLGTVLDDQYEVTLRLLEVQYDGRISAFLYNSGAEADLESDHSGTAFPDTNAFEAVVVSPFDANLMSLVAHEANHVIIVNAIGRAGTSLLNEGLPSAVLSHRYYWQGPQFYYRWTKAHSGQLPSIARLADDGEWGKVDQNTAYSEAASFLAYLLETYGPGKLKQLFTVRSDGFADRFAEIYGRPLATVEAEWLAFCASQG